MKRAILAPTDALPVRRRLAPPWPGRTETVDSVRVFVRDTPATVDGAPPALYVHGLGGSSQNWTDGGSQDRLVDVRVAGHTA